MCAIDYADERYEVYQQSTRRARKAYKCVECGRVIERGELYTYGRGLFENEWTTDRTCSHCHAAGRWLVKECGGFLTGGILEDLEEHADAHRAAEEIQKWNEHGQSKGSHDADVAHIESIILNHFMTSDAVRQARRETT